MEKKQKGIHDILPNELIPRILLGVPANYLLRLRTVCKLWNSLISDPDFAESHLRLSHAPSHACIFRKDSTEAYFVRLQEVFNDDNYAVKEVSCRGFVLLNLHPHSLGIWNPLTGSCKTISYSCIVSRSKLPRWSFTFPSLYGFGYDESRDDYLVVVAWNDINLQHHLDFFSLRTNSWISLDSALPKPFSWRNWESCGLFLNGAIHWLSCSLKAYSEAILIFDLKERSFSKISIPESHVSYHTANLVLLGGCLAFHMYSHDDHGEYKTYIWVMKEYKVQSSWTLYEIPYGYFEPLCLFTDSDIVALVNIPLDRPLKFAKYNVRKELLQSFKCPETAHHPLRYEYPFDRASYSVYTESLLLLPSEKSLLPLPIDIKDKDRKKKELGHQVRDECFEQLDIVKGGHPPVDATEERANHTQEDLGERAAQADPARPPVPQEPYLPTGCTTADRTKTAVGLDEGQGAIGGLLSLATSRTNPGGTLGTTPPGPSDRREHASRLCSGAETECAASIQTA
ncbi:hypothetical protein PIB30_072420 [Stylosanthes scabra]|uniref:F-box domain-containing protein n=1 Tax=Stylosanthes scabra TaxID=79078 RepID=A0ABU6VQY6_9FABA|nr:hypothetical protein [Stylosanthes scabra]